MKKVFKLILVILWMILIYSFSNQSGDISSDMSGGILDCILGWLEQIGLNFSNEIIYTFMFIIRKVAHYLLYFILGLLLMSLFYEYSISLNKQVIYAILICLIYASSDEIHQLFVPDRNGNIIDVFIDMFGGLTSIGIIYIFRKRKETI